MSTDALTFSSSEITLHWLEQYVSDGLNRKLGATSARGVYRGFDLVPSVTDLHVTVKADPTFLDHAAQVMLNGGEHGVAVKKSGGDFDIDLTAFANKTVVLALYVNYTVSATTTGALRIYQLYPVDQFTGATEKPILTILGTVRVPGAGTIADEDITPGLRMEAWAEAGRAATIPRQLIRNGSFEQSEVGSLGPYSAWYWVKNPAGASISYWTPIKTDSANSGESRSMELQWVNATGAVSSSIGQAVNAQVAVGDYMRVRLKVKALQVPSGGSLKIVLNYQDIDGVDMGAPSVYTIPMTAVDAIYRQIDQKFKVPSGAAFLSHFEIVADNIVAASDAAVVRVDDAEVWADTRTPAKVLKKDVAQSVMATALQLLPDPANGGAAAVADLARALSLALDASGAEAVVNAGRRDAGTVNHPILQWLGRMRLGSGKTSLLDPTLTTTHDASGGVAPVSLIWESVPTSGTTKTRIYVSMTGEFIVTVNAAATVNVTLTWAKDTAGTAAVKLSVGFLNAQADVIGYVRLAANDTNWTESGWDEVDSVVGITRAIGIADTMDSAGGHDKFVTFTAGSITYALINPALFKGRSLMMADNSFLLALGAGITLTRFGTEKIDGVAADYELNMPGGRWVLKSDGVDWHLFSC
jgi:hypothetical protein